ncbi:MAG: response regulator, partial [Bacteroidales bacterium]|nr:response regulator [Bacteroidales bacterium]
LQIAFQNYYTRGPEESPPYLNKAIEVYNSIGDNVDRYNINFTLSVSNNVVLPPTIDSIIFYGFKAISYIDTAVDHNELAYVYSEIGEGYSPLYIRPADTSDLTTALSWFFKALKLHGISDDMEITLLLNIASTYLGYNTDEHTSDALLYLDMARKVPDTCVGVYDQKPAIFQMLGAISYFRDKFHKAISNYKQGIQIAEDRLSNLVISEYPEPIHGYNNRYYIKFDRQLMYEGIYDSYLKLGESDKALEYYILSEQTADEIFLEQNQNLITMLEAVSVDEKNKSQIELLASENEMHKMRVTQSRTYLIVMGGFVLIIILVAFLLIRQRRIRAEHKIILREQKLLHELELKKLESDKLKELDKMKSRFFANISHEFRTPLTLIMRPLEKVLSKIEDTQHKKDLDVAKKYAGKLQHLINNLLTISKLESGKMQLRTSEIDILKLINNYVQAFESLAKQKNITLNFTNGKEKIKTFVDREKFEQILNNLLSNAFKFTGEGGVIKVSVGSWQSAAGIKPTEDWRLQTGQWAEIKISDTGCGIAPKHINHIFDRFYQAKQEDNSFYEGTGIGLALTKELVELHYGIIKFDSDQGKGSTFTILLPLGKDHLKPEEITDEKTDKIITPPTSLVIPDTQDETVIVTEDILESNDKQPILLIVEDNSDMRIYIREYFETDYHIIEAVDGLEGFKKSTEHIPDIIISDVMMPNMDGNEFCKKIKNDERTSHIPVILLTARASFENKMEGLEIGADDFITKPFDGEELQVRVKNLIEQRKRIRKLLEGKLQTSHSAIHIDFADSGITSMDEQFLQKVIDILKEHHRNPQFKIHDFGQHIGLSVAQLNRKIKALTGQSTADFIRTYRLNRAAELIKSKSATITEIAYDVGFS